MRGAESDVDAAGYLRPLHRDLTHSDFEMSLVQPGGETVQAASGFEAMFPVPSQKMRVWAIRLTGWNACHTAGSNNATNAVRVIGLPRDDHPQVVV